VTIETVRRPRTMRGAKEFQRLIWAHYHGKGRRLPWRETHDPYRILVSEIMLQQTQVERVLQKYPPFIEQFPGFGSLASSDLQDLLRAWNGLGYNRRALCLRETARRIESEFSGILPECGEELRSLPGIGAATAGALQAFVFEKPVVFIETNIRRVFIHFFFQNRNRVSDREILPLVAKTLDKKAVRSWYYALMDYGALLKREGVNPNRRSAHYARQSPFETSTRRIRGLIVKSLLARSSATVDDLVQALDTPIDTLVPIIDQLAREGFVERAGIEVRIRTADLD